MNFVVPQKGASESDDLRRSNSACSMSSSESESEASHFRHVVQCFFGYSRFSSERVERAHRHLRRLPDRQQRLYADEGHQQHLAELRKCVAANQRVLDLVVADVSHMFVNDVHDAEQNVDSDKRDNVEDADRVHSVLRQIVRDWSQLGAQERLQCYAPILETLEALYSDEERRGEMKVLVPGAGLGRLAYDIAKMGFVCQGNEFSLFMLFAANFVLNKCPEKEAHVIHPWIHQWTNNGYSKDVLRPAPFPDVAVELDGDNFSMAAGDFLEVYTESDAFDCVVTCFFIDCAHNILDFVERIHRILKKGGKWINLGPLLYHFADVPREWSIEPTYDVLRKLIVRTGFKFEQEKENVTASYCRNELSMMSHVYNCVFFVCSKEGQE